MVEQNKGTKSEVTEGTPLTLQELNRRAQQQVQEFRLAAVHTARDRAAEITLEKKARTLAYFGGDEKLTEAYWGYVVEPSHDIDFARKPELLAERKEILAQILTDRLLSGDHEKVVNIFRAIL